ncbi:MAG TPA: hypothetical protein VE619_05625 [Nitrososphaeraceae archaeon]|nr:hypothetical protein [Nitrososphaeraceae archaeon]
MFSSTLSQRGKTDQSIAGPVINAIMSHIMQQAGIDNLFSGGNNYSDDDRIGGIRLHLSNLMAGRELQQDHPLVQYVQHNADIQDPQQA